MAEPLLIEQLAAKAARLGPREAIDLLRRQGPEVTAEVMVRLNTAVLEDILEEMPVKEREQLLATIPPKVAEHWRINLSYPYESIGRIMELPKAVFRPQTPVKETIEKLRELVKTAFITYVYVTDEAGVLVGLVVMRELMLAHESETLADIMIRQPFALRPDMPQIEAMKTVLTRHFPVYPVTDDQGKLVGLVRGSTMFEKQAVQLTAQAGSMVGVEKEERLATPWSRSLKFRQPWLQLNLMTAFVAAFVVAMFQDTIDRVVVLAAFLPVLAGQSGNTGCQALAVALRGMTLGELNLGAGRKVVIKEATLGLVNGILVGITAGVAMYLYALYAQADSPFILAWVVFFAMAGSCCLSGISGVVTPLLLKRFGFDPATASSIFLTTATDVASMGMMLGLASIFV